MSITRKYYPIWSTLRRDGKVKLSAPKIYHRRIIKAVMKERTMDLEFRFLLGEANEKRWIYHKSTENMIELWLSHIKPNKITVENL